MTYTLRDGRTLTTKVVRSGVTLVELLSGEDVQAHVELPHAAAADLVEAATA